jgi:xylose isomerase
MFSNGRFMNGASTNPDLTAFSWACAKTKKSLDAGLQLGAENHVFWGGREGFSSYLNTDVKKELDNMGSFLNMVVDYKAKIGADYQLLIEPKPREPCKHQYDYDAQTVMGFLHEYGLADHYKTNIEPNHTTLAGKYPLLLQLITHIEPNHTTLAGKELIALFSLFYAGHDFEHDIMISAAYGKLGSIDANSGDQTLGWDTDQFCTDIRKSTMIMWYVLKQGGLGSGGLNFDAKVRAACVVISGY